MIYLCNAFSVNMLPWLWVAEGRTVRIERVSARETGEILRNEHWTSAFGHKRSAWHLSRYLHIEIPVARTSFKLEPEDVLLVAGIESRVKWERRDRGCPEWKFYRITVMEEEKTP